MSLPVFLLHLKLNLVPYPIQGEVIWLIHTLTQSHTHTHTHTHWHRHRHIYWICIYAFLTYMYIYIYIYIYMHYHRYLAFFIYNCSKQYIYIKWEKKKERERERERDVEWENETEREKEREMHIPFIYISSNIMYCWRSKDELIGDVLLWTPLYGRAKAGRPARTYIQQLCEDTGCSPEDLPKAMNDREKWRERARDIRANGTTWWWWYFYQCQPVTFIKIVKFVSIFSF